jgi:hypothetical protein
MAVWLLMLQRFRVHARLVATTALLSLVALTIGSATPHQDDCHDVMCASVVVPHDPSSHSVGRDTTSSDRPLHCVLCHWTRIVRPSQQAAQSLSPAVECNVRFRIDSFRAPDALFAAQPPLRAPPSSPSIDV